MIFNLPSCYFQSEDDEDSDGFDDEEDTPIGMTRRTEFSELDVDEHP